MLWFSKFLLHIHTTYVNLFNFTEDFSLIDIHFPQEVKVSEASEASPSIQQGEDRAHASRRDLELPARYLFPQIGLSMSPI